MHDSLHYLGLGVILLIYVITLFHYAGTGNYVGSTDDANADGTYPGTEAGSIGADGKAGTPTAGIVTYSIVGSTGEAGSAH